MDIAIKLSKKAQQDYCLILDALNNNSQKAYADLMNRYWDGLYYYLLKKTNNSCDAEDLTVIAFKEAFENLEQYRPINTFSAWLYKIAMNRYIDFYRSNKIKAISLDIEFENKEPVSEINNPESFYIKKEQLLAIKKILKKLDFKYLRLIELHYFQELTYVEIAEKLNLSLGTVKAQVSRAKVQVRKLLQNKIKTPLYYIND